MSEPAAEPPAATQPLPPERGGWRWAFLVALAAMALATFFFAPRIVMLRAQGVAQLQSNIEIFRSPWFLDQIKQPFETITNPSNQVIQWRLLFPLLGHYLHLPTRVMWFLPWVGCLLALAVAARMLWEHTRDRQLVWLGTLLAATCSWLFVATGWAFYFDGWLLAAMLLVAFARPRWQLFAAALITPWIDERIVLALPLCLAVRWTILSRDTGYRWRDWWRDGELLALGALPYLELRVVALTMHVWQPDYLDNVIGFTSPFAVGLEGAWHGLRAAWVPALLWPALVWRRAGKNSAVLGGAALAVLLGSVAFHVGMAGDVSRSASVAVPALLAGVILWREWPTRWAGCALIAVCAANFFLPARHVITSTPVARIPISYLHTTLRELDQPPDMFNPRFYNALGVQAQQLAQQLPPEQQGTKLGEAYAHFSTAIGLDPALTEALINRGVLLFRTGDKARQQEAMADFSRAVEADPRTLNGWLNRGIARRQLGDLVGSDSDLKTALAVADEGVARAPGTPEPYLVRSQLRHALGDSTSAAADVLKAIELTPANSPSLPQLRAAYEQIRNSPPGR